MAVKFKDTININGQYTLPSTDGSDGQALVTDGLGNLTFSSESIAGSADSAESTHLNVKNTSGASISKGTPVYVTGSVGATDKLEIAPADASNASHMPAIGLLESTLADNGEGFVVQGGLLKGLVTDTIDGSASTANDTVYVKAGGGLTLTKPTGSTNFIQNIAKVARVHSSNGSLIVSSILRTNDVPNLTTGKIWVGDGNTIESTVVHIDETNGRLGIGIAIPTESLHVLSSGNISRFESTTATSNIVIENSTTTTKIGSVSNNFVVDLDPTDSVASSNIILKSDGTERMRIDSSGVTTLKPVNNTSGQRTTKFDSLIIKTNYNGGDGAPYSEFGGGVVFNNETYNGTFYDSAAIYGGIGDDSISTNVGGHLAFYTSTTKTAAPNEKMRIDSSGNVGIGTTSPSRELDVVGVIQAQGNFKSLVSSSSTNLATANGGNVTLTNSSATDGNFSNIGGYNSNSLVTSQINFINVSQASRTGDISFHTHNGSNLLERMRIDSSGVTSVYNDFVLDYSSPEIYFKTGATHYRWMLAAQENVDAAFEITPSTTVGGSTYSTPVAVFKATGNVGIGTTSPSQKLTVVGNAYIAGGLLLLDNNQPIQWGNSQQKIIGNNSGYLQFITGNSEKMRIDSSGNVGINVTDPDAQLEIVNSSGGSYRLGYSGGTDSYFDSENFYIRSGNGGSNKLVVNSSGNVGIGTTSPTSTLHLESASSPVLTIKDTTNSVTLLAYSQNNDSHIGTYSNHSLIFDTNSTERMRIDSSGIVTGTITDNSFSDVDQLILKRVWSTGSSGDRSHGIALKDTNSTMARIYADRVNSASNYKSDLVFITNTGTTGTDTSEKMRIDSIGRVGIGITSPSSYDVNADNLVIGSVGANDKNGITIVGGDTDGRGAVYFADTTQNSAGFITYFHSNNSMLFGTSDNERMRIDSSGRVGIGMTPSNYSGYMLQVNGGAQSFMSFGNSTTGTGALNGLVIGNDSTGADIYQREEQPLRFHTNNTERFSIDSSGNATFAGEVEVINASGFITGRSSSSSNTNSSLRFMGGAYTGNKATAILYDGVSGQNQLYLGGGTGAGEPATNIRFHTGSAGATGAGTERMRISSGGNIGIGTTNPAYKLDISGSLRATTGSFLGNIGTSGSVLFNDNQGINFGNSNAKIYGSSADGIKFNGNGSEKMRLTQAGNVGIGTFSPGVALDVVGAIRATGDVTAFHSSDERLKANKKIIENATDKIEQIGGYEFDWLPKESVHINEGHDIGVIAQEVEKVIPEVVVTRDNGYKAVKYEKLVPLLIEAVKELSEKVKILENK